LSQVKKYKKRKLRTDRLLIFFVFIIIIIFIFSALIKLILKKETNTNINLNSSSDKNDNSSPSSFSSTFAKIGYDTIFKDYDDIHYGPLILINDNYKSLISPETMINLYENKTDYYQLKDMDISLDTMASKALNSLISGFFTASSNKNLVVVSGYRTENYQNILYEQALDNKLKIAKGGYCDHNSGLSFDLGILSNDSFKYYSPTDEYKFILDNCDKYGFILRYPDDKSDITKRYGESYHFRYVGIPHAYYMKQNNLSLEEYIEELKKYEFGFNTLQISCYSKEYYIYYIKAKKGQNEIHVPINKVHTISGNNIDGYIITCEK